MEVPLIYGFSATSETNTLSNRMLRQVCIMQALLAFFSISSLYDYISMPNDAAVKKWGEIQILVSPVESSAYIYIYIWHAFTDIIDKL